MPAGSPQAILPEFRTLEQYVRDAVLAQNLVLDPPRLVTAAGEAFDDKDGVALRVLQNCGTNAVYYKVVSSKDFPGQPATNPDSTNFHGIIAGGSIEDDGLGSILDCGRFKGRILVAAVGAGSVRLATFQARGPEMGLEGLEINNPNP